MATAEAMAEAALSSAASSAPPSNVPHYSFVIIGGGIAGVSCLQSLQRQRAINDDHHSTIALVSASPLIKRVANIHRLSEFRESLEIDEVPISMFVASVRGSDNDSDNDSDDDDDDGVSVYQGLVTSINTMNRLVHYQSLNDSTLSHSMSFDSLCIATGAVPTLPLAQSAYTLTVRDTDSVSELHRRVSGTDVRRVMIVGNGGIAMELVHTLMAANARPPSDADAGRGRELVWVIRDDYVGSTFFDHESSAFLVPMLFPHLEQEHRSVKTKPNIDKPAGSASGSSNSSSIRVYGGGVGPNWQNQLQPADTLRPKYQHSDTASASGGGSRSSLEIHFHSSITSIVDRASGAEVTLNDNTVHHCNLIIVATGVRPNIAFLTRAGDDSGIVIDSDDNGIMVDEGFHTSIPGIYSAGDCCTARFTHTDTEPWLQMRLWSQARLMGDYAGQAMYREWCNSEERAEFFFPLFTHTTAIFGLKVVLLGLFNEARRDASAYHRHRHADTSGECKVLMTVLPVNPATGSGTFIKLLQCSGRVIGATLIGAVDIEETIENLIIDQIDLEAKGMTGDWLNADVDLSDFFD